MFRRKIIIVLLRGNRIELYLTACQGITVSKCNDEKYCYSCLKWESSLEALWPWWENAPCRRPCERDVWLSTMVSRWNDARSKRTFSSHISKCPSLQPTRPGLSSLKRKQKIFIWKSDSAGLLSLMGNNNEKLKLCLIAADARVHSIPFEVRLKQTEIILFESITVHG
jgi:hypothetical protein